MRVFIDCFTSLDDLPRKLRKDKAAVKAMLLKVGRFSIFEHQSILNTIQRLIDDKEIVTDISCGFPWTKVTAAPPPASAECSPERS